MSRIGKLPVSLPTGVSAELMDGNVLRVKGPHGEMSQKIDPDIKVTIEDNQIKFERPTDQPRHRSMHGLYRALAHNMVVGVHEQYKIEQELVGVGYRVALNGQILSFSLGYSHDIQLMLPKEVIADVPAVRKGENPRLTLTSCDKQLLGQVAAKIRSFRKPEPYKGKGIKFVDEQLRRKAGKTAAAK
jgi:large subunit ribosomal protein L6